MMVKLIEYNFATNNKLHKIQLHKQNYVQHENVVYSSLDSNKHYIGHYYYIGSVIEHRNVLLTRWYR